MGICFFPRNILFEQKKRFRQISFFGTISCSGTMFFSGKLEHVFWVNICVVKNQFVYSIMFQKSKIWCQNVKIRLTEDMIIPSRAQARRWTEVPSYPFNKNRTMRNFWPDTQNDKSRAKQAWTTGKRPNRHGKMNWVRKCKDLWGDMANSSGQGTRQILRESTLEWWQICTVGEIKRNTIT